MDTSDFQGELVAVIAGTRREFWSPDNLKIYGDEPLAGNSCGAPGESKESQSFGGGLPSESSGKVPMHKPSSVQSVDANGGRKSAQDMAELEVTVCLSSSSGEESEDRTPMTELDLLVQKYDRRLKKLHPVENQAQSKKQGDIAKEHSRKYKCEACGKGFGTKGHLNQHVLIHGEKRNFSCHICDQSFKQPQNLSQHMQIHDSKLSYDCPVCDYSSKWKGALNQHLKLHSEKAEYKCDRCPKAYKRRNALSQHRLTHNFDSPFRCEKCDYGFKTKDRLTQHRKVHEDIREYKCEVCSKAFKTSGNLKEHFAIHSNGKLFPCVKCPKAFNRKADLKTHERTHTGERPFACCDCTKTFSHSSNLNKHRRICPKLDFRVKDLPEEEFYHPKGNLIDTFASTIYPDTDDGNSGFITMDEEGADDTARGTEDLDGTYTGRVIEVMPSSSRT